MLHDNQLSNNISFNDRLEIDQHYINEADINHILFDLDKKLVFQNKYFDERDRLIYEMKNCKEDSNKISQIQKLLAERDYLYSTEQEYFDKLDQIEMQNKQKKDYFSQGIRAPESLMMQLKDLVNVQRGKKDMIGNQKIGIATKIEKVISNKSMGAISNNQSIFDSAQNTSIYSKTMNFGDIAKKMLNPNDSTLNSISHPQKNILDRINRIDQLKQDHRLTLQNEFNIQNDNYSKFLNDDAITTYVSENLNNSLAMGNIDDKLKNLSALRHSLETFGKESGSFGHKTNLTVANILDRTNNSYDPKYNTYSSQNQSERIPYNQTARSNRNDYGSFNDRGGMQMNSPYKNISSQQNLKNNNSFVTDDPDLNQILELSKKDPNFRLSSQAAIRLTSEKANRMLKECQKGLEDVKVSVEVNNGETGFEYEENALKKIAASEIELSKLFSILPYSQDMYSYKINQVNKLAEHRQDMEKEVYERRIASGVQDNKNGPGKNYGGNNQNNLNQEFIDRKARIQNELHKAVFDDVKDEETYDFKVGFDLNMDYILNIPDNQETVQLTYGVYKGGYMIVSPKLTDVHMVEISNVGNKSTIGERFRLDNVSAHEHTMQFFELQFNSKVDNGEHTFNFGWTCIDQFSIDKTLKRGRHKLPFYHPPIDTTIIPERIQYLTPLPECNLYIRLDLPDSYDNKQNGGFNFFDDQASIGYKMPLLHVKKAAGGEKIEEDMTEFMMEKMKCKNLQDTNYDLKEMVDRQANRIEELMRLDDERYRTQFTGEQVIIAQLNRNPLSLPERKEEVIEEEVVEEEEIVEDKEKTDKQFAEDIRKIEKSKVGIKVDQINKKDQTGKAKIHIEADVYYMNELLIDDIDNEMKYKSNEYDTKNRKETDKKRIDFKKETFEMAYNFKEMFEEIKKLSKDKTLNMEKKNAYIIFKAIQDNKVVGWNIYEISEKFRVKTGSKKLPMYAEPILEIPPDAAMIKKAKNTRSDIEVKISTYPYAPDKLRLSQAKGSKPPSRNKPEPKEKAPRKERPVKAKPIPKRKPLADQPFIKYEEPVLEKNVYKNLGFDVYVDQFRFLPDNVTATKAIVRIVDRSFNDWMPPQTAKPDWYSPSQSPIFHYKCEMRGENNYAAGLFLFITLLTIDEYSEKGETSIVGFVFFPLFVEFATGEPSKNDSLTGIILHNGEYQIPMYCQSYPVTKRLEWDEVKKMDRLPGCSVLIRVIQAKKDPETDEVVNINSYEESKWEEKGAFLPFIDYRHGYYNTTYMEVTKQEHELYEIRKSQIQANIKTKTDLLRKAFGQDNDNAEKGINADELETITNNFVESKINLDDNVKQMDLKFLTQYRDSVGFSVSIDAQYNPPHNGLYVIIFCVNPPGNLYMETPDSDLVFIANQIDYNSSTQCIVYTDGWFKFEGQVLEKNAHIIFTVKEIVLNKKKQSTIKDQGFGILPQVTPEMYSYTGIYQIPLFKRDIMNTVVEELGRRNPWDFMLELMTTKDKKFKSMKLQMLEYTSLFVRLKDNFYNHIYKDPLDYGRCNYSFLPTKTLAKYIYNEKIQQKLAKSKNMGTLLPKGSDFYEMNYLLLQIIAESYQLKGYMADAD